MTKYIEVKTGTELERRQNMFFLQQGRYFSGLVSQNEDALYDDPDDSFAAAVGMKSSLDKGLIQPAPPS